MGLGPVPKIQAWLPPTDKSMEQLFAARHCWCLPAWSKKGLSPNAPLMVGRSLEVGVTRLNGVWTKPWWSPGNNQMGTAYVTNQAQKKRGPKDKMAAYYYQETP